MLPRISPVAASCGGDYVSSEGTLSSPNYPNTYSANERCLYKITVPERTRVLLSFTVFQLEEKTNCTYDYVKVYDGGDERSNSLGTFCGYDIPSSLLSSGNKMTILFRSDGSGQYKGFSAGFSRVTCVINFTGSSGTTWSRNYPREYNINERCIYTFTMPKNNIIQLIFQDFELEAQSSCNYDYLKIYDGDVSKPSLGKFCGSSVPGPIYSTGNEVTIEFRSDSSNQYKGFSVQFTKGPCDRNIVASEGTIESPNFPSPYDAHLRCVYTITVPQGNVVGITFQEFMLEICTDCLCDSVKIRDGHELSSPVIGPFCSTPNPVVSSGNIVTVEFRSDYSYGFKGFSATFESVSSSARICPLQSTKWKDLGGSFCYLIEKSEEVTWNDALYKCYKAGGSLASFHSQTEIDRVKNETLSSGDTPYYIGLRRNGDGKFGWTDKSRLDYTNWDEGERNTTSKMCGFMYPQSGKWNDILCDRSYRYICSSPKAVRSSFEFEIQKKCPGTNWRDFGGNFCYVVQESEDYTWNQASSRCSAEGGHLASFHSAEEVSLVFQHIKHSTKTLHIGFQLMSDGKFMWEDKTVVDFLNWKYDEPSSPTIENCSEIYCETGKWNDIPCSKKLGYICATPKVYPPTTPDGLNMACKGTSNGWRNLGGDFCYFFETDEAQGETAAGNCRSKGGNLASFHSKKELMRVVEHLETTAYIGLKRSVTELDVFVWADGTNVDFLYWDEKQPNNRNHKCVGMYQTSGKWNDIFCTVNRPYICSRPKVPSCSASACKNGECVEENNTPPRCVCAPFYKGLLCDRKKTCYDNPCKNGATCKPIEGTASYECSNCRHGYEGYDCEEKILCSSNPCNNSGTCTQDGSDGIFNCTCKPQFRGLTCEEKILCSSNPCGSSGTCTQDGTNGIFRCTCQHGYTGLTCKEKILCSENPCLNSGTCTQDGTNGVFMCTCKHGYKGLTCAEKIPCSENPCLNSETCTHDGTHGIFRCTCKHGYKGLTCAEKIMCSENPCLNSGTCAQDGTNGVYRCTCKHAYKGLTCAEKTLCSENPCFNSGTCTQDGTNGIFRCTCKHEYKGLTCAEKILCSENPCLNSGSCTQDGTNGVFRCTCKHGYKGLTCAEKILCSENPCLNSGTCTQDGTNGVFRCTCKHGHKGLTCAERILCTSSTCSNGGTCTQDKEDGIFRCLCKAGYRGRTCEESIFPYGIQQIDNKTYIVRGNIVLHINATVVFD